jgi:hypothetical protein
MVRKCLLITTAMIVVGSFSFFVAQSAAVARPVTAAAKRDRNQEFLCSYGEFDVSRSSTSHSQSRHSNWTHVAVPIIGHGRTVNRIVVSEGRDAHIVAGSQFTIGIYKNSRRGVPGKLITAQTSKAPSKCEQFSVYITPTRLKRGKAYWVEETIRGYGSSDTQIAWAINPKAINKAYLQYHTYSSRSGSSGSYTSPWEPASSGPYLRLT